MLVKNWSNTGQILVEPRAQTARFGGLFSAARLAAWSNTGQILVKYWSNTGLRAASRGRERRGVPRGPSRIAARQILVKY
jgi:hypothetical protein